MAARNCFEKCTTAKTYLPWVYGESENLGAAAVVVVTLSNLPKRKQSECMKNLSAALLAFLVGLANAFSAANDPDAIELRSIARGGVSGISEARQAVVKTALEWAKLWTNHRKNTRGEAQPPAVDFSKEMIAYVTMGQQRTGGYSVEIMKAHIHNEHINIFVKRKSPPKGAMATMSLTAPFHFVALPRSDVKVEFVNAEEDLKSLLSR